MISRRKFIALGLAGLAITGIGLSAPSIRYYLINRLTPGHVSGPKKIDTIPIDTSLSTTIINIIATLFGHELTVQDNHEISELLSYAASQDSGWVNEFLWLANKVDAEALAVGTTNFNSASLETREAVLQKLLSRPSSGFVAMLLATASKQRASLMRMEISTIPQLRRIYLASGAPWRRRGYQSWPGVPGDPREYTRPGPIFQC